MNNLEQLIRPNIQQLQAYSSARDEFVGDARAWLDANENPFGKLNRYPDPYQSELKRLISQKEGVSSEQIFIGNGSDEIIDLLFRLFAEPGKEKALTFTPTYGMYSVSAGINNVELMEIPLDEAFQIDLSKTIPFLEDPQLKIILICSPNNPTGNLIRAAEIKEILTQFQGIVVIDEAYIDFAESTSWNQRISDFPNLVITQTFSKAQGLAAARLGIAYANAELIQWINRIKPPYNVSQLNQECGIKCLENPETINAEIITIRSERKRMIRELESISFISNVFPTDANFILVKTSDANQCYERLINQGIIVRNRSKLVPNTLRISIGTRQENDLLLSILQQFNS